MAAVAELVAHRLVEGFIAADTVPLFLTCRAVQTPHLRRRLLEALFKHAVARMLAELELLKRAIWDHCSLRGLWFPDDVNQPMIDVAELIWNTAAALNRIQGRRDVWHDVRLEMLNDAPLEEQIAFVRTLPRVPQPQPWSQPLDHPSKQLFRDYTKSWRRFEVRVPAAVIFLEKRAAAADAIPEEPAAAADAARGAGGA